jgi:hypothetical protein
MKGTHRRACTCARHGPHASIHGKSDAKAGPAPYHTWPPGTSTVHIFCERHEESDRFETWGAIGNSSVVGYSLRVLRVLGLPLLDTKDTKGTKVTRVLRVLGL